MVSGSSGKLVWQTVLPEDWSAMRLSLAADTEDPAIHVAGLSNRRAWAPVVFAWSQNRSRPSMHAPPTQLVQSHIMPIHSHYMCQEGLRCQEGPSCLPYPECELGGLTASFLPTQNLWLCSGSEMHVWTLAARDGGVQRKKQDRLDAPLQGPVLCKRGHAYAFARDSYWLCRMPLSGAHFRPSGACATPMLGCRP